MDTEKYLELEKKIEKGLSPNDEGPFYHHSWWESYKGSIKGKLGGALIGAIMGVVIGGAIAGVLAITTTLAAPVIGAAFAALASAGVIYGMHEFSEIGKVVGAQAAGLEQADAREAIRFAVLEKKLDALTDMVKGNTNTAKSSAIEQKHSEKIAESERIAKELETYRTTHYAQLEPDRKNRFIFSKVAVMGLVIGAAVGAILAFGGASAKIFETIGIKGLSGAATHLASIITFGMFGASFGINRDIFRKTFDQTDLMFKGIIFNKQVKQKQIEAGQAVEKEIKNEEKNELEKAIATQDFQGAINYPESNTYHRDRVLAAAEKALLSFDHTRATPH